MRKEIIYIVVIILLIMGCPGNDSETPDYEGTWKGYNIEVSPFGNCDIEVILTKTDYEIYLYNHGETDILPGSNKGTIDDFTESGTEDVWNILTLTTIMGGTGWEDPEEGDLDYAVYRIEGDTMHFKYDINEDHVTSLTAQGDLTRQ